MISLQDQFNNIDNLARRERLDLLERLELERPDFYTPYITPWRQNTVCPVKVLIVCDGSLNFGYAGFHLSEFLTIFPELKRQEKRRYEVTLGHRTGNLSSSNNRAVVNQIANFKFDSSVKLEDFDQLWLFGISRNDNISLEEVAAIHTFMDGGGGVFATGDHGSLGTAMCSQIKYVKDMRYWGATSADNATDNVSMNGPLRNDTNQPPARGLETSSELSDQSDAIPQTITPVLYHEKPHPLLAISKQILPSGAINIMPDHPHEGQCKDVTAFHGVTTQIIATSLVLEGNTASSKQATSQHVFNSIAAWDGRRVGVGRVVVDSTWHHFVNINLNGSGTRRRGLLDEDLAVVKEYYKNIVRWITRRKVYDCDYPLIAADLLFDSQVIESCLDHADQKLSEVTLADLNSIGVLVEETLAAQYNPAYARTFLLDLVATNYPAFADKLNPWLPKQQSSKLSAVTVAKDSNAYYQNWVNLDLVLHTMIGAGFKMAYEDKRFKAESLTEKNADALQDVIIKGLDVGYQAAIQNFKAQVKDLDTLFKA
ncbi:MAG: hypothetical protein ACRBFS_01815 [Aureispira sp.]